MIRNKACGARPAGTQTPISAPPRPNGQASQDTMAAPASPHKGATVTASPTTRRKIAPAATMVIALLGSLALLFTFVTQVAAAAPPSGTDEVRASVLAQLEESPHLTATSEHGKIIPDTLEIIDETPDGVVAFAFLTTTEALGIGVQDSQGGSFGLSAPGQKTHLLKVSNAGNVYELAVRRSGSGNGYEHTFTAE